MPYSDPDLCHALGSGADPVNVLSSRENKKKDFHTEHTTAQVPVGFLLVEAAIIDLTFLQKLIEIRTRLRIPDLTSTLLKNMQRPEEVTGSLRVGARVNSHLPDMSTGIQTQVGPHD